jgi:hypothetical protein
VTAPRKRHPPVAPARWDEYVAFGASGMASMVILGGSRTDRGRLAKAIHGAMAASRPALLHCAVRTKTGSELGRLTGRALVFCELDTLLALAGDLQEQLLAKAIAGEWKVVVGAQERSHLNLAVFRGTLDPALSYRLTCFFVDLSKAPDDKG